MYHDVLFALLKQRDSTRNVHCLTLVEKTLALQLDKETFYPQGQALKHKNLNILKKLTFKCLRRRINMLPKDPAKIIKIMKDMYIVAICVSNSRITLAPSSDNESFLLIDWLIFMTRDILFLCSPILISLIDPVICRIVMQTFSVKLLKLISDSDTINTTSVSSKNS